MANDLDLKIKITAELSQIKSALSDLKSQVSSIGPTSKKSSAESTEAQRKQKEETQKSEAAAKRLEQTLRQVGVSGTKAGSEAASGLAPINSVLASIKAQISGIVLSFAGFFAVDKLAETADSAKLLEARLKLVTKAGEDVAVTQSALLKIANDNLVSLQAATDLYFKTAQGSDKLGVSQKQLLTVTDAVSKALRISGASAEESKNAILQFGQGLATGLKGDELRTVLELAPRLGKAIAESLGIPFSALRDEAAKGALDINKILNAIISQSEKLTKEAENLPLTIGGAFQILKNNLFVYIGQADKASGVSGDLAKAIKYVAENLDSILLVARDVGLVLAAVFSQKLLVAVGLYIKSLYGSVVGMLAARSAAIEMGLAFGAANTALLALRGAFLAINVFLIGWAVVDILREKFESVDRLVIKTTSSLKREFVEAIGYINKFAYEYENATSPLKKSISELLLNAGIKLKDAPGFGVLAGSLIIAGARIAPDGDAGKAYLSSYKKTSEAIKKIDKEEKDALAKSQEKFNSTKKDNAYDPSNTPLVTGGASTQKPSAVDALQVSKAKIQADISDQRALLSEGVADLEAYYAKLRSLTARENALEIQELQKRLKSTTDADQKSKILTDIEVQRVKGRQAISALYREEKAAVAKRNEDIKQQNEQLQIDLFNIEGNAAAARAEEVEKKYNELFDKLKKSGNVAGIELAKSLFSKEKAKAQFDLIEQDFNKLFDGLKRKEEELANRVKVGNLTPTEADRLLTKAQQDTRQKAQPLIDQAQLIADKNPDIKPISDGINKFRENLNATVPAATGLTAAINELDGSLKKQNESFALNASNAGIDALTNFFTDIATKSKSAKEALLDFAASFLQSMVQIAARALATYAVLSLLNSVFPGAGNLVAASAQAGTTAASVKHSGGIAGMGGTLRNVNPALFGAAPRYHAGGIAGLYPGEVPAILQRGEEVLAKNDPRNSLNGGNQQANSGTRIVNVIDPSLVSDYLTSSAGERVIVNIIEKNSRAVKNVLV